MVRIYTILMAGIAFSIGLFLGLALHLPGVSSPSHAGITRRERSVPSRNLLQVPRNLDSHATSYNATKLNTLRVKSNTEELTPNIDTVNSLNPQHRTALDNKTNNREQRRNLDGQHLGEQSRRLDVLAEDISTLRHKKGQIYDTIRQTYSLNPQGAVNSNVDLKNPSENPLPKVDISGASNHVYVSTRVKGSEYGGDNDKTRGSSRIITHNHAIDNGDKRHVNVIIGNNVNHDDSEIEFQSEGIVQNDGSEQLKDIVNGVYWTRELELLTPGGFTHSDTQQWRRTVDKMKITTMKSGCGRMQNRQLTMDDASHACARYRINTDQIQGEIFSYYLSRLLGITNVPPSILTLADSRDPRWAFVGSNLVSAQWNPERVLIMTPWLDDLTPAFIPHHFRPDTRQLNPTPELLLNHTTEELTELVQWSDLIIFDYLTANLDRVVNNMFNKQWNADIMNSPAHNLEKSQRTNSIIFFDNESGLFHSYRLLEKYAHFHESLLSSLCVFRESTANAIKSLHDSGNIAEKLQKLLESEEPKLHRYIAPMPLQNSQTLQKRIDNVYAQIQKCERRFPAR